MKVSQKDTLQNVARLLADASYALMKIAAENGEGPVRRPRRLLRENAEPGPAPLEHRLEEERATLGARFRAWRESENLSLVEAGKKAGVHATQLAKIEKGRCAPRSFTVRKLERVIAGYQKKVARG